MKVKSIIMVFICGALVVSCSSGSSSSDKEIGLKDIVGDKFLIGAAINVNQSSGRDTSSIKILKRHFNSIVAENCMKSEEIHPEEDRFDFSKADEFIDFGLKNNMSIIGHCLIWHSQCPSWFFVDDEGNTVSAEVLKERMKTHISTVVGRYKGKVKGWDVVNEAFMNDGSYRKSKFYEILGEEFIPLAFKYAYEADSNAELYYNDFNMSCKDKRESVITMIKNLKSRGLRIDAVGMQSHFGIDYPDYKDFEDSMLAFAETGVKVMITEWDMSALPTTKRSANIADTVAYKKALNPYPEILPDSVDNLWNERMKQFFNLFEKHSDIVTRVTAWGISDGDSWKNDFPIKGRHDFPLLFDRNYQPKKFVKEMIENYALKSK